MRQCCRHTEFAVFYRFFIINFQVPHFAENRQIEIYMFRFIGFAENLHQISARLILQTKLCSMCSWYSFRMLAQVCKKTQGRQQVCISRNTVLVPNFWLNCCGRCCSKFKTRTVPLRGYESNNMHTATYGIGEQSKLHSNPHLLIIFGISVYNFSFSDFEHPNFLNFRNITVF